MIQRNLIVRGVLIGITTGVASGVVETFFVWLAPFAELPPNAGLTAWHWQFTAVVMAGMIAAGAAAGAVAGLTLRFFHRLIDGRSAAQKDRLLLWLVLILLVHAYEMQVMIARGGRWNEEYILCVVIALILAARILVDLLNRDASGKALRVLNPVGIPLLILGLPWIRYSLLPYHDTGRFLMFGALIVLAAGAARWFRTDSAGWLKKSATMVAAAAVVVAGAAGALTSFRDLLLPLPPMLHPASGKPDVVLIVMDTTRADHLSAYGYAKPTTPRLEEFAAGATLYREFVATSNYTLPTHASIFTGASPRRHGAHYVKRRNQARRWSRPLDPKFLTLAEVLSANGYRTGAVSSNVIFVARGYNFDQGFQQFEAPRLSAGGFYLRRGIRNLLQYTGVSFLERLYLSAADVNRRASSMLGKFTAADAPFFLFLNYMDAHTPWTPPAEYERRFEGGARKVTYAHWLRLARTVREEQRRVLPAERQSMISQYDASLAYLDANLGRMLDHLKEIGRYKNSLIVILGDHGESFGEHQFVGHTRTLYQSVVHVPLLIKLPGQQAGRVVSTPVSQVDIMPTILDAIGVPLPPGMDGSSLLADPASGERPVFAEALVTGSPKRAWRREYAVFFRDAKLIMEEGGVPRLFRPWTEPAEENDLYVAGDPLAGQLLDQLDRFLAATPAYVGAGPERVSREELDRLRDLGYIQ